MNAETEVTMTRHRPFELERQARALLGRMEGHPNDQGALDELSGLARALVSDADSIDDHLAASLAWRVIALVERARGRFDVSARSFDESIRLARAGGSETLAAESRVSLAGLHALSGSADRALAEIEDALVGRAHARAIAQRATILADLGRFDDALDGYAHALPLLRDARDGVGEIITRNSRSGVLLHLGRFAEAEADLIRAERRQRRLGGGGILVDLLQNLGEVVALRGDLPRALRYHELALAEAGGEESAMAAAHRIDALLGARLLDEAQEAAERALAGSTLSDSVDGPSGASTPPSQVSDVRDVAAVVRPEIEVLAAQAALIAGRYSLARERSARAAAAFKRQGRPRWSLLARQVGVRAALAGGPVEAGPAAGSVADPVADPGPDAVAEGGDDAIAEARALARSLAAAGWTSAAAETWLAAGEAALARGQTGRVVRSDLEAAATVGIGAPASDRLRAARAAALLALLRHDPDGARRALRRGLGVLDAYRAALGATELRAHASAHGEGLATIGLRIAVADGDPAAVLEWSERWRASTLDLRPVRPPDDAALADDLANLRRVSAEIDRATIAGTDPAALVRLQRGFEQAIRSRTRQTTGAGASPGRRREARYPTLAEVGRRLEGCDLVSFVEVDGAILALSVRGRGRSIVRSIVGLGSASEVRAEVEAVRFSLRRLARGGGSDLAREGARSSLGHAAARLDELLFAPIGLAPGSGQVGSDGAAGLDRPVGHDRPVSHDIGEPIVIVPTGPLHALPWALLPSLRSRPVTVAPSVSFWCRDDHVRDTPDDDRPAGRRTRSAARPSDARTVLAQTGALLVAGPGLEHADLEIAETAAVAGLDTATVLVGPAATAAAVCAALPTGALAHLACHGHFRADNPMFSSLTLVDGPLYVYDLERLGRTPPTIVLSACDSGLSAVRPGEELLGLAAALFSLGTRNLVASVVPVPDDVTRTLMVALHRELRAGAPPATALARARTAVSELGDAGQVAAAAFVCFGRCDPRERPNLDRTEPTGPDQEASE
jgi:tetratricopeptide (TPR) repeat protein